MTGMFVLDSPYKIPLILMALSGCRPSEAISIMTLRNGKGLILKKQNHPDDHKVKIDTIVLDGEHTKTRFTYTWGMHTEEAKTMYAKLVHQRKHGWLTLGIDFNYNYGGLERYF